MKKDFKEFEEKNMKHMMATKAIHLMGDISSDEPDLCYIYGEDGDNWVGNWITGYGFFNVRFPKTTTRDLTEEEKNHWNGKWIGIHQPDYQINIK